MLTDFKLPDLGEGVHEGQIVRLLVAEGEQVREDQPLMEVETDKAAVEIPSPHTGVVSKLHVTEHQVVNVGDVMVTFDTGGESTSAEASAPTNAPATTTVVAASEAAAPNGGSIGASLGSAASRRTKPASPAVRKLARQRGVDLDTVQGSGPGGRVTRRDVELTATGPQETSATSAAVAAPASESVAAMVDTVVRAPSPRPTPPAQIAGTPGEDQYGPIRRAPITQARKTIANIMAQSWTTIPHVTDTDEADVTLLDQIRRGYNSSDAATTKLTLLPFVVRAVAVALRRYPIFNSSFDADSNEIIYKQYINIAVGVHTERGLIPPVIRDTDQLGVSQLNDALNALAEKARSASFAVNDLRGGTFTISNAGAMGGSRFSTPIITPPQVAVLAVGRTRQRPWVVDGEIAPRLIMPISISFDHRIIDGGAEIAFQQDIIASLESPGRILL